MSGIDAYIFHELDMRTIVLMDKANMFDLPSTSGNGDRLIGALAA